ncbi:hypothetical protein GFS24_00270 [Chitinophaga sp. SYP-B3965]|uniref:hypothetical protein n=1 Tax=Chitinophaga sp. SYP-B3965 TaxID=2663120 RepID=UPI00129968D1|nr:hypothetical protein [Chitinophaga sp. SYP-B3965]MRG43523.1 hypothetical protein [Chitinophaga sp. SYP-B3965]
MTKLIVWAILLCGSPLLSIAQPLPPTFMKWDTTKAFSSLSSAMRLKKMSDAALYAWLEKDHDKRKPLYDSLICFNGDDFSIAFYKTLLVAKKDQRSLLDFKYLVHLSDKVQKDRLEYLFNLYPSVLRESAEGKEIQARICIKQLRWDDTALVSLAVLWCESAY